MKTKGDLMLYSAAWIAATMENGTTSA